MEPGPLIPPSPGPPRPLHTAPDILKWVVEQDRTGQPDPVTVPSETVAWIRQTLLRRRVRMLN
jgi:hypothetical protein